MIKAIIFDCFGVLASEAWLSFKARHFGGNPKLFAEASNLSRQANSGLIGGNEFTEEIAKLAGVTPAEAAEAITSNVPDKELFEYIGELKKTYKVGLLSNISSNRLSQIFSREQLDLFDSVILSFEHGFIKPQPEAYEMAAQKLGVETSECVLIDDQERNTEGARNTGMKAILFEGTAPLKTDLESLVKAG